MQRLTLLFLIIIPVFLTGCRGAIVGGDEVAVSGTSDTQRGNWNLETAPFPGEGYYTGVTSSLSPTDVCVGKSIFGAAGARVCHVGSTSSLATADQILAPFEAWDASGNKITGSIPAGALPVSNALRDPGTIAAAHLGAQTTSLQLSQSAEVTTHSGSGASPDLPTTGGYSYRDIPDATKDDDGLFGIHIQYAPRPTVICGTSGGITARIANCAAQNPATSSWDGAVNGNRGQGLWKLVTNAAANMEVWQDTRTGLLWSSLIDFGINWCQASGNTQPIHFYLLSVYNSTGGTPMIGNGTIGSLSAGPGSALETISITFTNATTANVTSSGGACQGGSFVGALTATAGSQTTYTKAGVCSFTLTQGTINFSNLDNFDLASSTQARSCEPGAASGLQPAAPISYCAEAAGLNPAPGENWATGTYFNAKGGMGANAVDKVRWRLPTIDDYKVANANGLRFVMPDLGVAGFFRPLRDASPGAGGQQWSASFSDENSVTAFQGEDGFMDTYGFDSGNEVRCVGR